MPLRTSSGANAANRRTFARHFTDSTPSHHPFLDPNFAEEDASLVPKDLAPRGGLSWELPQLEGDGRDTMLKSAREIQRQTDCSVRSFHADIGQIHRNLIQLDHKVTEWAGRHSADAKADSHTSAIASSIENTLYEGSCFVVPLNAAEVKFTNSAHAGPRLGFSTQDLEEIVDSTSAADLLPDQDHRGGPPATATTDPLAMRRVEIRMPGCDDGPWRKSLGPYEDFWREFSPYRCMTSGVLEAEGSNEV